MDYIEQISAPIEAEFDEFRKRYSSLFSCSNPAVDILLKFLSRRNGKMMRPILALLVSKSFGQVPDQVYNLASAIELLHQGSLIHDDVVDESEQRRGRRSANAAFDNRRAVLLGDYVVSMALQQIVASGDINSVNRLSTIIGVLSEGEINQLNALDYETLSEDVYFDIISKKTAILFSSCSLLSAQLSGASPIDAKAFEQFGHIVGLCFQIMDDILDYHPSTQTGKPSGNDLKEGKFTLPAIYALNNSGLDWSLHIKAIRSLSASPEQISQVTDYTVSHGGIDYAVAKLEVLKKQAIAVLPAFISQDLRTAFVNYLDLITNRSR